MAFLGAGNDAFVWNPGDDNDTVEGQAGIDRLDFNGANIAENIDISANGGRVLFTRDVANVTMDLNDVEAILFRALGGADNIVINDSSGTDLSLGGVVVDLAGAIGSSTGDGQVDTVTVNGSAGNETININTGVDGRIQVVGSSRQRHHLPCRSDRPVEGHRGRAGNDIINASALPAGAIALTLDGGAGNDTLIGSQGNDVIVGGTGVDHMTGGAGQDTFAFFGMSLTTLDTGLGANRDVVEDFAAGDVINLGNLDADLNTTGDQAFAFIGANAFSSAGQVRFFQDGTGNTIVEGNIDNNLGADFQIELHNFAAQLQVGNFLL